MGGLRAAQLSPPGEGGISVIAVAGEGASEFVASRIETRKGKARRLRPGRLLYGRFLDASGEALDEVIAACKSPTYVEINCHGGAVPARRILRSLAEGGVRLEGAGAEAGLEEAGGIEREALEALRRARTDLAARVFAAQYGGALRRALDEAVTALGACPPELQRALDILSAILEPSRVACALARPAKVALQGPVNAGKSTLANALAGFPRTIVSDVAGTTRDAVGVSVSILGVPVTLVDTAGAGPLRGGLDAEAARRAGEALDEADATIIVVDASIPLPGSYAPRIKEGRTIVAANKSDVGVNAASLSLIAAWKAPVTETSGVTGDGVDELSRGILAVLGVPLPPGDIAEGPAAWTERQVGAIRSAIEAARAGNPANAKALLGALLT